MQINCHISRFTNRNTKRGSEQTDILVFHDLCVYDKIKGDVQMEKRIEDLNLEDDFLFSRVMSDEEICRIVLELSLIHI